MTLSLEEEKPKDQIAKALAAVRFENADVAEAEGTVLPPDAAGTGGNAVQEDNRVPADSVEVVGTAAENRGSDGENGGEVFAGGEPFTLDHNDSFLRGLSCPSNKGATGAFAPTPLRPQCV
jgi:hypothetical protein